MGFRLGQIQSQIHNVNFRESVNFPYLPEELIYSFRLREEMQRFFRLGNNFALVLIFTICHLIFSYTLITSMEVFIQSGLFKCEEKNQRENISCTILMER